MLLNVEGLCLNFFGLKAVHNVDMLVEENKITGLIGPNGAGKTTFFNLISGVYKPDSGTITFCGERIDGKQPFQINKTGIARTYQVINLFRKMTVLENVLVGMHSRLNSGYFSSLLRFSSQKKEEKEARERAIELLDFVGIKRRVFDEAGSLSYGEQRYLEIVRGLASEPRLLLLDEPAAGMNSAEKLQLDALLQRILKKGIAILIIEHDMKLMMGVADYIYVLNYGEKLAEGTSKEIQNNPNVIAAYLGEEE
jgi:branched-chain amino acid transport system ATP-binding protein